MHGRHVLPVARVLDLAQVHTACEGEELGWHAAP